MIIYYVLIITTCITYISSRFLRATSLNAKPYNWKRSRVTIITFFGFLLIMLCLRSETCGVDVSNYKFAFDNFSRYKLSFESISVLWGIYGFEIGYIILNLIIQVFSNNFQLFMAIVAALSLMPIAVFYFLESEDSLLSISLFVTFGLMTMYFSGLRQVLGLTFVVPLYYCCKKRKMVLFVVLLLLATMFHQSAFIMIFMYPAFGIKLGKKHLLLIIPLIMMAFIFNKPLFAILTKLVGYDTVIRQTGAYKILILLAILIIYVFGVSDEKLIDFEMNGLRNLLILSLLLQMFAPINDIAMRMNYYYLILVPITLSKVQSFTMIKYRSTVRFASMVMICFFLSMYVFSIRPGDIMRIYPYDSIFN